jgi:hypothetical protein
MFEELGRFVARQHSWGATTGEVGEATETGYCIQIMCGCGAGFERWVTPGVADRDLRGRG